MRRVDDGEALNLSEQILAHWLVNAPGQEPEPLLLVDEEPSALFPEDSRRGAVEVVAEAAARSGIGGLFGALFLPWSERRHTARTARTVLERFRSVAARHPELGSREHYRLVVMEHARCNAVKADGILSRAEESYAHWPADRDLNLCDVAHYLSVSEFLTTHGGAGGIRSELRPLIAGVIPRNL